MTAVENIGYSYCYSVVWEGRESWLILWERHVIVTFTFDESVVHCLEAGTYEFAHVKISAQTYFLFTDRAGA